MVSLPEAAILTTVGLAFGKAIWDNRKDLGDVRRGVAILLYDRGHDPEAVMNESVPVQADGGDPDE